ncbi:unnamed protein product [Cuscuta campestris]|uniref:Uncharacterized protein n=2 Tax=Cuscuta campestris TaxID=132261 RepID=A0A484N4C1_9ASTE|nr:unnamed protein product [Cuscuta campestris]
MCTVMYSASAEHSTVYVKLVTGTAIAWSLSHVGLDLTESRSNGWTTQRQWQTTTNNHFNLRYILENNKLSGTNFLGWEMNLRIVLNRERKLYILETDPPKTPDANARASELTSFKKYEDDA